MIKARVLEVSDLNTFELDGQSFRYRFILFDIGDGKLLRTQLWGHANPPAVGQLLKISIDVSTERNRKNPSLFYHKVNLKYYEDYHQPLWIDSPVEQQVPGSW